MSYLIAAMWNSTGTFNSSTFMCSSCAIFHGSRGSKIRTYLTIFSLNQEAKQSPAHAIATAIANLSADKTEMIAWKTRKHFKATSPKLGIAGEHCYDSYPTLRKKVLWNFNWKWQLGSKMYFCLPYILGSRNRKECFPPARTTRFLSGLPSQIWRPYKRFEKTEEATRR